MDPVQQVVGCAHWVILLWLWTILDSESEIGYHKLKIYVKQHKWLIFELLTLLKDNHEDHGHYKHQEYYYIHYSQYPLGTFR